jgi:hypothetical protein
MQYEVRRTSQTTWEVEKDSDGTIYYNSMRLKDNEIIFICSCIRFTILKKPCKHTTMCKENLVKGTTVFDV